MRYKQALKDLLKKTKLYQKKREFIYYAKRTKMLSLLETDEMPLEHRHIYLKRSKAKEYVKMLSMVEITIRPGNRFQTWIDTGLYFSNIYSLEDNTTPNYGLILENSIVDLLNYSKKYDNKLSADIQLLLRGTIEYIDRIVKKIDSIIPTVSDAVSVNRLRTTREYFVRMKDSKSYSLEEAFQRILFWSSIFWQSQHRLVGIGRLDKLLTGYNSSSDATNDVIGDFYKEIHRYYAFKSNSALLGDTGQIIELGGIEPNGSYFANEYTYRFIEVMRQNPLPDPKLLLRVSSKMPNDLIELAIRCIATGVGCPLLSNDDVVIPAIEKFGYSHTDACNYVTSACWEPMVYGKSLEKNNMACINYGKCFENVYLSAEFIKCNTFNELLELFLLEVDKETEAILFKMGKVRWEKNTLRSLFTAECIERGKDISEGGARYNNYGILSVGMANAVDSLMNVKKYCFDESSYSLEQVRQMCIDGDPSCCNIRFLKGYGRDDKESIGLVKTISDRVYERCSGFRNCFGGKVKWGLSASNYIEFGTSTGATFDGRKRCEPLAVHISAPSDVAYTELVNFAVSLDYSDQSSNGNVIDYFVSPDFIEKNFDKFLTFIKVSISEGFFQMQMNVVNSKTLIDAKENPELYPGLIVRVWGFSAYFNDLPDEYKEVLINRAVESEKTA